MAAVTAILKIRHNGRDITGRDDERPENVPIRAWRQIMKSVFLKVGRHWHETYLPLHFSKAAYYRYPEAYTRRTDAYFKRWFVRNPDLKKEEKQAAVARARAEHNPLVFRGTLREMSRHAVARAFQTRVTITIPTPAYVTQHPRGARINMYAEMSAVNRQEYESLTGIAQRQTDEGMRRFVERRELPDLFG